ncbi:MAG: MATE family efflux transporter [Acidimicrobiales bacterium]|nr:MATE family efflux transporter [Acidimicrobiales bacterium]
MQLAGTDRELLRLAVPAVGALVAEPLYLLADTAVVGHLGTSPLAGLAVASGVLLFAYGMCIFLAYGTTASVARLTGAGRPEAAAAQAVQGLWLAASLGVTLAVLGAWFGQRLLGLLGAEGPVLDQAGTYLRISLLGAPAMLVMLAGVGYLRGLRDTMRPLWVAVGTAALNLILEVVLIYGFGLGIGASAAATVGAQWIGAGCYLAWIGSEVRCYEVSLGPDRSALRRLALVSTDLMVRNLSLGGTFLVGTSVAARIGAAPVAAHQVAFHLWMTLALTMDGLAIAAQAMVGTALGAGDGDGARRIGRRTIVWSVGVGITLGLALLFARDSVSGLFSNDPAVVGLAGFLLLHVGLMAPLSGVAFALDGILIGAGDQRFMARAMTASALVATAAMAAGRLADLGIGWLWAAIWVFVAGRSVILGARFRGNHWVVLGAD